VQLKLNQYKEAKQSCNKALEVDGGNVKCLFRRAQVTLLNIRNPKIITTMCFTHQKLHIHHRLEPLT
jgi:hypothetical protein